MAIQNVNALGDAYTDSSTPTTNNNGAGLVTGWNATPATFRSFISFTMPTINGTITNIRLKLYRTTALGSGSAESLYQASASFDETTITWNNQPTTSGSVIYTLTNDAGTGAYKSWDIYGGSALNPLTMTAGNTYYFLLKFDAENNPENIYADKENADSNKRPYLEITYTPPFSAQVIII